MDTNYDIERLSKKGFNIGYARKGKGTGLRNYNARRENKIYDLLA
jgi:hypothetical protein